MAAIIPTGEPKQLRAGDTWQWYCDLPDYPASEWTLTYTFANSSAVFSTTAAADGVRHLVTVTSGESEHYTAGEYQWVAHVASDVYDDSGDLGERYTVSSGIVTILPNLAVASSYDYRTFADRMLAAVEAALEGRPSKDADTITFGDRTIRMTPLEDLERLRAKMLAERESERAADRGQSVFRTVRHAFR